MKSCTGGCAFRGLRGAALRTARVFAVLLTATVAVNLGEIFADILVCPGDETQPHIVGHPVTVFVAQRRFKQGAGVVHNGVA